MVHNKFQMAVDGLVLGAIPIGALANILPPMAAAVSIVYGLLKIAEMDITQRLAARIKDELMKDVALIKSAFDKVRNLFKR